MTIKQIINESIEKNPSGLKQVFEEVIMERIAIALEAKKLDKVNPDALKGDFEDREDKDIDNDGKVDSSDEYLHKRRQAIAKAMKKESVELDEAKMSDAEVLAAAKKLASNAKDAKTKEFGKGLVDFYAKNKSFTPAQVGGLQNIMKNAGFQLAKESVDLLEVKKKDKPAFGSSGGFSYAVNVDGIDNEFLNQPFGRQLDSMKKVKEFMGKAKKGYAGAKGKSTLAAVKDWVKLNQPTQFYAKWKSDSSSYKDDSVEIYYMKEANESLDEVSKQTLANYITKASDASKHRKLTTKKVDNRYAGVHLASNKLDKKLSGVKESINESKEYEKHGADAFKAGIKRQVVLDPKMKKVFDTKQITDADLDAMKAWYKGWDRENLK